MLFWAEKRKICKINKYRYVYYYSRARKLYMKITWFSTYFGKEVGWILLNIYFVDSILRTSQSERFIYLSIFFTILIQTISWMITSLGEDTRASMLKLPIFSFFCCIFLHKWNISNPWYGFVPCENSFQSSISNMGWCVETWFRLAKNPTIFFLFPCLLRSF